MWDTQNTRRLYLHLFHKDIFIRISVCVCERGGRALSYTLIDHSSAGGSVHRLANVRRFTAHAVSRPHKSCTPE